jgi:leucyl/phenylalanyl-tRNA---protein transferase
MCGVGADLEPGTLLAAYRAGLFPMPVGRRRVGWWSPDPRGIVPLDTVPVSRSLRASMRRFRVTRDEAFTAVMTACGDPRRPHGWINREFIDAYSRLHRLGWAHSIEVWRDDELVGGLYGVRIGRFFAGESMFHLVTDASKVAFVHTVEWLRDSGATLFDVQWTTDHLSSLGAIDVPRAQYLRSLAEAVAP